MYSPFEFNKVSICQSIYLSEWAHVWVMMVKPYFFASDILATEKEHLESGKGCCGWHHLYPFVNYVNSTLTIHNILGVLIYWCPVRLCEFALLTEQRFFISPSGNITHTDDKHACLLVKTSTHAFSAFLNTVCANCTFRTSVLLHSIWLTNYLWPLWSWVVIHCSCR